MTCPTSLPIRAGIQNRLVMEGNATSEEVADALWLQISEGTPGQGSAPVSIARNTAKWRRTAQRTLA
jgi:hypothetical protein